MTDGEFDSAMRIGLRTAQARELMANHCSHGRVELHGSSSMLGQMVGLPIGLVKVHCEHAPAPNSMAMDGLAVAVEFYRRNCVGCEFRNPNGVFPTLAMESDAWAAREEQERASVEQKHAERVAESERRRRNRRAAVSTQGYAARDIAEALDTLDPHPDHEADFDQDAYGAAGRQLREAGRRAPELFDSALVAVLITDARATGEPAVVAVLGELAAHGRASAVEVANTAVELLISAPSPDAGSVFVRFAGQVDRGRLVVALPNVVRLSAPTKFMLDTLPGHPEALLAAVTVVPEDLRRTIVELLAGEDPAGRASAAHAAGLLFKDAAAAHLPVLGPALVRAVHGRAMAYAGEPDPNGECRKALAAAWKRLPVETRAVVGQHADVGERETADSLYGILRFVPDTDDPARSDELSRLVIATATEFRADRLSGDWGVSVAMHAARDLREAAREAPALVAVHRHAAFNALLEAISADIAPKQPPSPGTDPNAAMVAMFEETGNSMTRTHLRSALGELVGVLARNDRDVLAEVVDLLHADSGDEERDSQLAEAMLDGLSEAVTTSTITVVLPELYSALLSTRVRVRCAAVQLWEACAQVVGTVPEPLAELAGTLLSDSYVTVHRQMLDRLSRLGLPEQVAGQLVNSCAGWVLTYEKSHDERVLEDALHALLWTARCAGPEVKAQADAFVLEHLGELSEFDRERMLLYTLQEYADTPKWGEAALALLTDPSRADIFHQPDNRLAYTLFQHPAGIGAAPLESFRGAVMNYLPELPRGTTQVLAVLQGTDRYQDAADLADEAAASVPDTDEFVARRRYLLAVAQFAHDEMDAINGVSPAPATSSEDDDDAAESPLVRHAAARRTVRAALGHRFPHPTPEAAAAVLTDARGSITTVDASSDVNLWLRMIGVGALLLRWDTAIRTGDDAEAAAGSLAAARRQAQVALSNADYASQPIKDWLGEVASSTTDINVDDLLGRLSRIPAPLAAHDVDRRPRLFRDEEREAEPQPLTAVTVLTIDGTPVADLVVLDRERSYRLGIDVRVEDWPADAVECEVQLLSVFPKDKVLLPSETFTVNDVDRDEFGVRMSTQGDLYCGLERRPGQPGYDIPLLVVFRNADGEETKAAPAGHTRLRMRPFDSTQDSETGYRQLDGPLYEVLDRVTDDSTLDPDDVAAFGRFFTALVRAAPSITFAAAFRSGKKVSEGEFHDELEAKLLADSTLGGRVSRRDPIAGGFDDLMHDGIVAELKVEKTTPRTIDNCARYLGQPDQYGVGKGSRLSILVVLDHSRKQAPAGVLENYIGWVVPAMHGYTDPRYPSFVGVVIINTHWILPSSWSRRTIDIIDQSQPPVT